LAADYKQIQSGESPPILLLSRAMTNSTRFPISALRGPVPLSHLLMRNFVQEGDRTVDATCGNGHDTLLLATLVSDSGHVWGFDIQQQAITETGRRVGDAALSQRVTLVHAGHEELARHVTMPVRRCCSTSAIAPAATGTLSPARKPLPVLLNNLCTC